MRHLSNFEKVKERGSTGRCRIYMHVVDGLRKRLAMPGIDGVLLGAKTARVMLSTRGPPRSRPLVERRRNRRLTHYSSNKHITMNSTNATYGNGHAALQPTAKTIFRWTRRISSDSEQSASIAVKISIGRSGKLHVLCPLRAHALTDFLSFAVTHLSFLTRSQPLLRRYSLKLEAPVNRN